MKDFWGVGFGLGVGFQHVYVWLYGVVREQRDPKIEPYGVVLDTTLNMIFNVNMVVSVSMVTFWMTLVMNE